MPFKKGDKKPKSAGRVKGTPNKRTEKWEDFVEYCLNGGLEKFQEELSKLEGEKYVNAFTNLIEYHKPKLARSDVNHSGDITIVPPVIKIQPLD
jgi:hypothetical protein